MNAEKNLPLVLSEQTFHIIEQITTGMPGGFFIYKADDEGELIYANRALYKIYGCQGQRDFQRYVGNCFRNLVHPDDWERVSASIDRQIAENENDLDYVEYRIIRKDGTIRWIEDYGHFVHTDFYGDVFYVFVEDATERHLKQLNEERVARLARDRLEALNRLEHETTALKIVHEVLRSGMWTMEFDERANMVSVLWSDEFRRMIGYQNETDFPNTLGAWSSLLHEDDRERVLEEYYSTIADYTNRKIYDVEYRLLTKDRGYRWFRTTGKLSRREDGTPITFAGTFVDTTERKEMDQKLEEQRTQLEAALEQAQQSNRAKTVFLNNMSHDIRTPMNAIIGFTTLASAHIDDQEQVKDYLSKIMASSNHLLSLINDVLDMSRIESGKISIREAPCSLSEIMHELKTMVQADINAKQMEFFINTMDVVDENIFCDKMRLNQVLLNVISNAVKFTPSHGTVSVHISEKRGAPDGYAFYEFRVRDNGIGMKQEFLKRIFEPFERERTSTVSGLRGTGLGMTITKNIVDMMKGSIQVESQEGKGTEFTISFQFRLAGGTRTETAPELAGLHVLVVDDHFDTCASVTKMLSGIGMRVEWTTSGKEAVLRAQLARERQEEFDVYLIDWMMPDLNGIEITRQLRRLEGEGKPIIITTAYDWAEIKAEAEKAGVTAFCAKPLFLSELRAILLQYGCREHAEEEPVWRRREDIFAGKRVLLVEDNELNQEIAATILEEAGLTVEIASDGAAAVEMVKASEGNPYQIVLMDIQMPVKDGYEATREIRQLESPQLAHVPIIALTANALEEDKQHAAAVGMDFHLGKPIEIDRMMETLEKVLREQDSSGRP